MTKKHAQLWYLKRNDKISGPFPAGLISRHILIGRIHKDDELSPDRKRWLPALEIEELKPKIANDQPERVAATKRWADERIRKDRRLGESDEKQALYAKTRSGSDRRSREKAADLNHRDRLRNRENGCRNSTTLSRKVTAIALFLVAGLVTMLLLYSPSEDLVNTTDCNAPPSPGVNWEYCQKPGTILHNVDLSYSNLSNINLANANLQYSKLSESNLSYASLTAINLYSSLLHNAKLIGSQLQMANLQNSDLQGADLSYSNLHNATLTGANLSRVNLSHAIWIDGSTCLAGSIGQCLVNSTIK